MKKEGINLFYISTIIISICIIIIGNIFFGQLDRNEYDTLIHRGIVKEILTIDESEAWQIKTITAIVTLPDGRLVTAFQSASARTIEFTRFVQNGDRVILSYIEHLDQFDIISHERLGGIIILGVILVVLILLFGRIKGLNGIVALG